MRGPHAAPVAARHVFDQYTATDVVRFLLLAGAVTIVSMSVRVLWLRLRRPERPAGDTDPTTTALVVGSYTVFLVLASVRTFNRLGDPPTWRLWLYALGVLFGFAAELRLLTFQRFWRRPR